MNNKKNNLENELANAGIDSDQTQQFFDDLEFVERALDEYQPVPSPDFNDRVKAAVFDELDSNRSHIFFHHHFKSILAFAAMLLLVFSLVFTQMGPTEGSPDANGKNTEPVAKIDLSGNPFAQPDLIMEVLMEQQSANNIDGMTLDAVSSLWDGSGLNQQDDSSNNKKGKNNENIA